MDLFEGDKKREAELLLKQVDNVQAQAMAQIEANRVQAQHSSLFVAGARPFLIWVCGVALAMDFVVRPLTSWAFAIWWPHIPALPSLVSDNLWELMMGMLGLAGLRTFEKVKGVTR
jgi:hypothetical protein